MAAFADQLQAEIQEVDRQFDESMAKINGHIARLREIIESLETFENEGVTVNDDHRAAHAHAS